MEDEGDADGFSFLEHPETRKKLIVSMTRIIKFFIEIQ